MNPAQLLAHFERLAEAPDAVPRLRRFILDLAVRGKLVGQDENEEPATELVDGIEVEPISACTSGPSPLRSSWSWPSWTWLWTGRTITAGKRIKEGLAVPRILPPLLALILAAGAVWLHLPSATIPVTAFARGSFAVLPEAEQALKAGNAGEALKHLRTAYARAVFEGRPGIAERIRTRTGLAGVRLLDQTTPPDPARAWPFLEAFALWSDDFNRDAGSVEAVCLSRPALRKTRFEYHLTRPDGSTFWAGQPILEWTGLWPFWVTWMETTTKPLASGLYLETGVSWPVASYALAVPLGLRNQTPLAIRGEIAASGIAGGAQCLFTPPNPFGKAEVSTSGHWIAKNLLSTRDWSLTRVILFSDALPGPRCLSVTLVRDYLPL